MPILVLLFLLIVLSSAVGASASLYVMDSQEGKLHIIRFDNGSDLTNSPYTVAEPVDIEAQLPGGSPVRDLHVLGDGNLLVEFDGPAPRLAIWSSEGVIDNAVGRFGGMVNGTAALAGGGFISNLRGGEGFEVHTAAIDGEVFAVDLLSSAEENIDIGTRDGRMAGRADGGLVVGLGWMGDATVAIFQGPFESTQSVRRADVIGVMHPAPKDVGFLAPFPGGWAARGSTTEWIFYPDQPDGAGEFHGTTVSGTAGGRIVDIAPLGPDHTAALYMSWQDPDNSVDQSTNTGQAVIQIWTNASPLDGPIRTIELGFNLIQLKEAWNRAKLAGTWISKEE